VDSSKFANSFAALQRIFGYVYKFSNRIHRPTLTVSDLQGGTLLLLRLVQRSHLWDDIKSLQSKGNRIPNARRSAFVASNANPWLCIFCNDTGHSISYCQNLKILSPANRLRINCLKVGHQVRQCNTLLHLGNSPSFPSQEGAQLQEALPSASPSALPSTSTALIAQELR